MSTEETKVIVHLINKNDYIVLAYRPTIEIYVIRKEKHLGWFKKNDTGYYWEVNDKHKFLPTTEEVEVFAAHCVEMVATAQKLFSK